MLENIVAPESPILSVKQLVQLAPFAASLGRRTVRRQAKKEQGSLRQTRRGHGLELLELRAYQPHDEVKHIDWRVTARTGQVHTRLYAQENDHVRLLLLQLTNDAYFGTRHTFVSTRYLQLASLLGYRAKQQQEQLTFWDGCDGKWQHFDANQRWQKVLEQITKRSQIPLQPVIGATFDSMVSKGHGYSYLVLSNRIELSDPEWQRLSYLSKHHDVTWILIDDQRSFSLPPGQYQLMGETGATAVTITKQTQHKALQAYERGLGNFHHRLQQHGVTLLRYDVENSPIEIGRHLLHRGVIR